MAAVRRMSLDLSLLSTFTQRRSSTLSGKAAKNVGLKAYLQQLPSPHPKWHKKICITYVLLHLEDGRHILLVSRDGASGKDIVNEIKMDHHRIQSYRVILASTRSLLNIHPHAHLPMGLEGVLDTVAAEDEPRCYTVPDPKYIAIQELLATERHYQDQLHRVLDVYAEPLRKFSSLTNDEHRILFSGPEALLSLSLSLSARIEECMRTWNKYETRVGCLFSKTLWQHYDQYCEDYHIAKVWVPYCYVL